MPTIYARGDKLPSTLQREALSAYVHRHTREHVPSWARDEWKDGKPYPVQFDSDKQWLARTLFPVKTDRAGNFLRLAEKPSDCTSYPMWPDNPELRDGYGYREEIPERGDKWS